MSTPEQPSLDSVSQGPLDHQGGRHVPTHPPSADRIGPSVLNGDLGVAPGTALTGFGLPAVVNGATHDNDGVAAQAQLDLTTAYDVAAGQPVAPADDLSGQDLGNKVLTAGAQPKTAVIARRGTASLRRTATVRGAPGLRGTPGQSCIEGFRATVRGAMIKRVVFRLDGKQIRARSTSPFQVVVKASEGRRHNVTARVTFKDATRAKTLSLGYRACAAAVRSPARGPSQFTG